MSDSVRPHRRQPKRLHCPWDSPGKNTEVGCDSLLQCMKVKSLSRVWPSAIPWTAAFQAPPSMGFSRQEYWSGVPLPSPLEGAKRLENERLELGEESPGFWVEVGCSIKQDGQMGLLGASIWAQVGRVWGKSILAKMACSGSLTPHFVNNDYVTAEISL